MAPEYPPVPRGVVNWFQAQDAPLMSSKALRTHLAPYAPHLWPEVTRLSLLYGIAALRATHGSAPLGLDELGAAVGAQLFSVQTVRCSPAPLSQLPPRQLWPGRLGRRTRR